VIYFDHNATTPLAPRVREAMLEALDRFGNPSSHHAAGRAARAVIDDAREVLANLLGARTEEIIFTSGGTESLFAGVRGATLGARDAVDRAHPHGPLVTTPIEHAALGAACESFDPQRLAIDAVGRVDPAELSRFESVGLLAFASANNEIGTRQPVRALSEAAHSRGARVLVDAVQSLGKEPVSVDAWGVDLLALSAHKIGGPKGVGALYVRRGTPFQALLRGGPQEAERRAGTENLPGIAGFAAALEAVPARLAAAGRVRGLRDRLQVALTQGLPDARLHGDPEGGLGNTLNVYVPGVEGDPLRVALDLRGLCCSGGSACASGAIEPSHVLLALGCSREEARSSLRLSLGPETTDDEVSRAASTIIEVVLSLRR
jgi:cysteine desulfurase